MTETPVLPPGTYTMTQVMTRVGEIVEENHKRLYMPNVVAYLRGERVEGWNALDLASLRDAAACEPELAECGTAACLLGWTCIIAGFDRPEWHDVYSLLRRFNVSARGDGRALYSALYNLFYRWPSTDADTLAQHKVFELRSLINEHRDVMDAHTIEVKPVIQLED